MLNLDNYAQDYAKLHASYEKQAYLVFKRALDAQTKKIREYVEANGITLLNTMLPLLFDMEQMKEAYLQVYTEIGVRHARNYSRLLDKMLNPKKHSLPTLESKTIGFSSEFWRNIMEQFFRTNSSEKITGVNQTTIDRIKQILGDAQQQNLTTTQQARYLVDQLKDARFNATRALVIARTESSVGANRAAAEVAAQADFELLKGWSAALDNRTRNSHRVVGRTEPIPLNEYFQVPAPKGGMELALHPGDSSLSAANVVNCRCSLYHVPRLDESGLPIPIRE